MEELKERELDSHTLFLTRMGMSEGPRIATLSRNLPPEEAFAAYQWVKQFVRGCEIYENTLDEAGVMEFADTVLERTAEGGSVPPGLLQKVTAFHQAYARLFYGVEIEARDWITNQFTRPEVAKFSAKAKSQHYRGKAEEAGLAYIDSNLPQPKKRKKRALGVPRGAENAG